MIFFDIFQWSPYAYVGLKLYTLPYRLLLAWGKIPDQLSPQSFFIMHNGTKDLMKLNLNSYMYTVHIFDLLLIFKKWSLKNQVGWTWFFVYFELEFWKATQAVKIKFEIDKTSSSSNVIFQIRFFQNQVQINRGIGHLPIMKWPLLLGHNNKMFCPVHDCLHFFKF